MLTAGSSLRLSPNASTSELFSTNRIIRVRGNVGAVALTRIRDTVGMMLDIPL